MSVAALVRTDEPRYIVGYREPYADVVEHLQDLVDLHSTVKDQWDWLDLLFEGRWASIDRSWLDMCKPSTVS
jgi:hypothetical protein